MKSIFKYIIIYLQFIIIFNCSAQSHQKYEPPDGRVIHGLGQYTAFYYTDSEYWQLVKQYQEATQKIPVIYSVYAYIDPLISAADSADFIDIITNHDNPYLLVVGLALMDFTVLTQGTINIPVQAILNGSLDNQIMKVINRIKALNEPVFLRPGFEFGLGNSGIHNDPDVGPQEFKNIWIYLYNKFQEQSVNNVAWVWNTVNPNTFNYLEWYPGDEYVDWWGINYFTSGQISASQGFLDDAKAHEKPVMICESNPILNGGTTNNANWEDFFIPYFEKIKQNNQIKAFIYINSSWEKEPLFNWPDSRITSNQYIVDNFKMMLKDSAFINMDEYLSDPDLISSLNVNLKNQPQEFNLDFRNYPNPFNSGTLITWKNVHIKVQGVDIFNLLGEMVDSFSTDNYSLNTNSIYWDAQNYPSGIYYAVLRYKISDKTSPYTRKKAVRMLLIK